MRKEVKTVVRSRGLDSPVLGLTLKNVFSEKASKLKIVDHIEIISVITFETTDTKRK